MITGNESSIDMRSPLQVAFKRTLDLKNHVTKEKLFLNVNTLKRELDSIFSLLCDAVQLAVMPEGHRDQMFGGITYAQHGDDLMLLNLVTLMGLTNPTWLDLGAHDPFVISNTALLYARGFHGVNVEANPDQYEKLVKGRPGDKNLNFGVDDVSGTATLYLFGPASGRNTFSREEVLDQDRRGFKVQGEIIMEMRTLTQIVQQHCDFKYPDILLCDIEGYDYKVLNTMTALKDPEFFLPKIIVVETRRDQTTSMIRMMESKGFVKLCRMGENLFFVRSDLYSRVI